VFEKWLIAKENWWRGKDSGKKTDVVGENLPSVPHISPKIPTSAIELPFTT